MVPIDQTNARKVARLLGLSPRGTISHNPSRNQEKSITKDDVKQMLATLIEENFRISANIYRDTLQTIKNYGTQKKCEIKKNFSNLP